jgi:hypothetical protein
MKDEWGPRQAQNDGLGPGHCTNVRPMQGVLDRYEAFNCERHDKPDGQKAEHWAEVDERLTPAFPVENLWDKIEMTRLFFFF